MNTGLITGRTVALLLFPARAAAVAIGAARAVCIATGAVLALSPVPAIALPVDLELAVISELTQVGIKAGRVGFTLNTTAKNVGPNPIPWGFPVIETANNPWIQANVSPTFPNGFTGQEGAFNHTHNLPPQPPIPGTTHPQEVGPHPHIQFFLYRQPVAGAVTVRIGQSDLKHTYLFGPPPLHEAKPGGEDSYSTKHNQDQSFYGPLSELDLVTFRVAAHDHMASPHPALGPGHHRDHGELAFAGGALPGGGMMPADPGHPGVDNIDHLLQAPLADMLPAPGVRWFLAGTYYVVEDINLANNSRWIEIFPAFDAVAEQFSFTYGSGGLNLATLPKVPEPSTLFLLAFGLAALVGFGRMRLLGLSRKA